MVGRNFCIKQEIAKKTFKWIYSFEFSTSYTNILALFVLPHWPLGIKTSVNKKIKGSVLIVKFLNKQRNEIPLISHYFFLWKQCNCLSMIILNHKFEYFLNKGASNVKRSSIIPLIENADRVFWNFWKVDPKCKSESITCSQMTKIIFLKKDLKLALLLSL